LSVLYVSLFGDFPRFSCLRRWFRIVSGSALLGHYHRGFATVLLRGFAH
jgi:hypothetical protein